MLLSLALRAQTVPDDSLPNRPSPPRLVNDLVGMLSPGEVDRLEQKLVAYNDSTSSQLAIVVVKSTGLYEPADYAFSIGRKWGVGQKGKNNGVVLLWATGTRKIYIATGRGMEGVLPDAIAKRIVSQIIAPNFKRQEYYQGLDQAVDEMFRRATGEYKADPCERPKFIGWWIHYLDYCHPGHHLSYHALKRRRRGRHPLPGRGRHVSPLHNLHGLGKLVR